MPLSQKQRNLLSIARNQPGELYPQYERIAQPQMGGPAVPAVSQPQRKLFAIAEHHPDQLYARNAALANLPKQTLHDFAATKGLPKRRRTAKPRRGR
jgi:hypothetical protein